MTNTETTDIRVGDERLAEMLAGLIAMEPQP